jgi:hypothetical protein
MSHDSACPPQLPLFVYDTAGLRLREDIPGRTWPKGASPFSAACWTHT